MVQKFHGDGDRSCYSSDVDNCDECDAYYDGKDGDDCGGRVVLVISNYNTLTIMIVASMIVLINGDSGNNNDDDRISEMMITMITMVIG